MPSLRADEDLLLAVRELDGDHRVPFLDAHRDDAARARVAERGQVGLLDDALARAHHHVLLVVLLRELLHREERRDLLVRLELDQVHDRLPLAARPDVGHLVDLEPVGAAAVREDHDVGVR